MAEVLVQEHGRPKGRSGGESRTSRSPVVSRQ
jgi:hypothetical protein